MPKSLCILGYQAIITVWICVAFNSTNSLILYNTGTLTSNIVYCEVLQESNCGLQISTGLEVVSCIKVEMFAHNLVGYNHGGSYLRFQTSVQPSHECLLGLK